eukprot:8839390-Pyramimonas_sp.AAC.1
MIKIRRLSARHRSESGRGSLLTLLCLASYSSMRSPSGSLPVSFAIFPPRVCGEIARALV